MPVDDWPPWRRPRRLSPTLSLNTRLSHRTWTALARLATNDERNRLTPPWFEDRLAWLTFGPPVLARLVMDDVTRAGAVEVDPALHRIEADRLGDRFALLQGVQIDRATHAGVVRRRGCLTWSEYAAQVAHRTLLALSPAAPS